MTLLLIGIGIGIGIMAILIKKYFQTPRYDYFKIDLHCTTCGDVTNGLKCPRCENKKISKKY